MLTPFLMHEFLVPVTSLSPLQKAGINGRRDNFRQKLGTGGKGKRVLFCFCLVLPCLPWNIDLEGMDKVLRGKSQ